MTSIPSNAQNIDYQKLLLDALTEMRQMRSELESLDQEKKQLETQLQETLQKNSGSSSTSLTPSVEPVAIIGMDCRFPGGANSPEAYWSLLRDGVDAMVEVPPDRWDIDEFYDPDPDAPGKMYTRVGGFIDGIDQFDPQFFGISPRETISLDPQQRLLLEVSHTALERAGQSPEQLRGSQTGVFVGLSFDDYASRSIRSGDPERIDAFSSLGNTRSIAVGRVSYVLGLQGPTLQLDTTCSSSLFAVHLACQSLRSGEASMALAGGVSAMLSPEPSIGFCKLKALSADGRCKTFDASANGYSRGEGCGMVVLKRYDDAVANGDRVLGIIRGSAVNHDGQSNGLTAPNGSAQADVIRQAIANANVAPSQIQYVEAHGTGTSLGDPIELIALGEVLGEGRTPNQPLRVGAVKTNIGHLEASAGVAGLIKVILALQHRQIPPHLHFQQPNPYIPWDRLPVEIPTALTPFHQGNDNDAPLLAGISSFGMSGTNVHIVVGSPVPDPGVLKEISAVSDHFIREPRDLSGNLRREQVLVLSAKTPEALILLAQSYLAYLQEHPNTSLDDVCFTAATGRSHYDHRLAAIATSVEQCCQSLQRFINEGEIELLAQDSDLIALAQAYLEGQDIDWNLIYPVIPTDTGHEKDGCSQDSPPTRQRLTLPTYPFQRQRYWMEPPCPSTRFSNRSPLHPLLGHQLQVADVDTIHFESVLMGSRIPFVRDHRILDTAILPAAAYLEMAISASHRQANAAAQTIDSQESWSLTNVEIHSAMAFGGSQRDSLLVSNEEIAPERIVQLVLTPQDDGYQFKILSKSASGTVVEWQDHAEGKLEKSDALRLSHNTSYVANQNLKSKIQNEPTRSPSQEGDWSVRNLKSKIRNLKSVDVAFYYDAYREIGIDYGSSLRVIEKLWQGEAEAIAQLSLPKGQADRRYHLHPILLDAGLQTIGAALSDENQGLYLPVGIGSFQILDTVDTEAEASDDAIRLWVYVEYRAENQIADIQFLKFDGQAIAVLQNVQLQAVSAEQLLLRQPAAALQSQDAIDDWFYQIDWQLHPHQSDLLKGLPGLEDVGARLNAYALEHVQAPELLAYGEALPLLEKLSTAYAVQALQELGWDNQSSHVSNLGIQPRYQRLLDRLIGWATDPRVLKESGDLNSDALHQELKAKFPVVETELLLLADCGSNLAAVMQGDVDPLQLLFPNGDTTRMTRLYQDSPGPRLMNELVQEVVSQIATAYPTHRPLRILEIGAGTGGTTAHLLSYLQDRTTEYTFTDVSPLFLSDAQERFREYPFVDYQVLDIEQTPQSQEFPLHHWDVIIAANVLHATEDIQTTLAHVRQLLATDGRLIILEVTQPTLWLDLIFGLTEGWWRFNDAIRSNYPLMDEDTWQRCLTESGFDNCQLISPVLSKSDGIAQQTVLLAKAGAEKSGENGIKGNQIKEPEQHWLIWSDQQGMENVIAQQIEAVPNCSYSIVGDGDEAAFALSMAEPNASQLTSAGIPVHGIIYLAALDAPLAPQMDSHQLHQLSERLCTDILTLVQTLVNTSLEHLPELWLITRDTVHLEKGGLGEKVSGVAQSLIWGLGKAIALEYPELRCRCIDMDARVTVEEQARSLWSEIYRAGAEQTDGPLENQVVLRGGDRYVSRLIKSSLKPLGITPLSPPLLRGETGAPAPSPYQGEGWGEVPFRLAIAERGSIDNLYFEPIERRSPSANEVEIQVQATGLNFRDVLNALDLYPGNPGLLGCECVGRVVTVGNQVNGSRKRVLQVGDEVMAIAPGSFSQFITIDANLVVHRPRSLTVEEAATIPVAFLTAYYTLYHLGGLKAEDRRQKAEEGTATNLKSKIQNPKSKTILVHAASGGVGQAAIQLAHLAGAEVFATASPAKWEQVRQLGVARVANSRSLEFADEVMDWTNGEGVDLVLNSLSGDFIAQSLACVKSGGHFIEIGKRDVWSGDRVAQAHSDIAYRLVDLVEKCHKNPELIREMLGEIARLFKSEELQPLSQMVFPIDQAPKAFRTMQQAQHIGKVVVNLKQTDGDQRSPASNHQSFGLSNNSLLEAGDLSGGTFLITGGLGGLGLQFADWLIEQGVQHLALVSRREPDAQQQERIQTLEEKGATVQTYAADVADFKAIAEVMQNIAQFMPPLKGIIHGAGVLDDGVLRHQTWERFERVLNPKVQGAWNLHQLTQRSEYAKGLEHFILFSSATALLGSPGQANHVTANTFLDTLAHHRRALGLPGLSLNWGVWSDIGSAAKRKADQTMAEVGIGAIAPSQGIRSFEQVLAANPTQVGVLPVDWSQFFKNGLQSAFLSELERAWSASIYSKSVAHSVSKTNTVNFVDRLLSLEEGDRHSALAIHICQQIGQVLGFKAEDINPDKGFFDLGMDSLTSVELKNKLQTTLGCTLSPTVAFDYPTVNQLTEHLLPDLLMAEGAGEQVCPERSRRGSGGAGEAQSRIQASASSATVPKAEDFSQFSDDELLDLLAQELTQGGDA